jgi:putative ATPase
MKFDKNADNHYDLMSALQKSIRGSDPNAAVFYLSQILLGGDLQSACRRLMVIASEDIGLAYPMAASIVNACVDNAM